MALFKFGPYLFMWAAFSFLYLFMPNVKVRLRSALIGGICCGTLWQLLQWGYLSFQFGVARYNAIYGTMAALPIFMVWLYLSWLIVLLGVELTFVHQNLGNLRQEMVGGEINADGRERAALGVLVAAGEAFLSGARPMSQEQLALRVGLPTRLTSRIVEQLVRLGFLVEVVTGAGETAAYQPARPPETTGVAEVLAALHGDGEVLAPKRPSAELQAIDAVLDQMRNGGREALAGCSLLQLVGATAERREAEAAVQS
jgi:membrane protein